MTGGYASRGRGTEMVEQVVGRVAASRTGRGAQRVGARGRQVEETRQLIMAAAERLFAQHGVAAVSSRQISEEAGQGNNAAVGYHFGSKTDLVRAIVRRHSEQIEGRRAKLIAALSPDAGVRDWVDCLVRPFTEHIAELGAPTWYARFSVQLNTDPVLRELFADEHLNSPSVQRVLEGLRPSLEALPGDVRDYRLLMTRHLIRATCAERERTLSASARSTSADWDRTARLLIDAVAGLLLAPVAAAS